MANVAGSTRINLIYCKYDVIFQSTRSSLNTGAHRWYITYKLKYHTSCVIHDCTNHWISGAFIFAVNIYAFSFIINIAFPSTSDKYFMGQPPKTMPIAQKPLRLPITKTHIMHFQSPRLIHAFPKHVLLVKNPFVWVEVMFCPHDWQMVVDYIQYDLRDFQYVCDIW